MSSKSFFIAVFVSLRKKLSFPDFIRTILAQSLSVILLAMSLSAQAGFIDYKKEFYAHRVAADAPIQAGALIETWAGDTTNRSDVVYFKGVKPNGTDDVKDSYLHAVPNTKRDGINGLLANGVQPTGKTVAEGYNDKKGPITDGPPHLAANSAQVEIDVGKRQTAPPLTVLVRHSSDNNQLFELQDYVKTALSGKAEAGVPTDNDKLHSANSFAAASIQAQATFQVVEGGQNPTVTLLQKPVVAAGRGNQNNPEPPTKEEDRPPWLRTQFFDPAFISVTDITDPSSPLLLETREVMSLTVDSLNAAYLFDDTGIRLRLSTIIPDSYVSFIFQTDSDWVLDPYTYGATFSASGLTAFGETPIADWTLSSPFPNVLEAFLDFSPIGGTPFDFVEVRPDSSLFTPGHIYSYEVGDGDGGTVLESVPEPSSLALFFIGWVLILYKEARKRRRSTGSGLA